MPTPNAAVGKLFVVAEGAGAGGGAALAYELLSWLLPYLTP